MLGSLFPTAHVRTWVPENKEREVQVPSPEELSNPERGLGGGSDRRQADTQNNMAGSVFEGREEGVAGAHGPGLNC